MTDDIVAYFGERSIPLDEIEAVKLADEVLGTPPILGCLTITTAFQWRLTYSRAIKEAGTMEGVLRLT